MDTHHEKVGFEKPQEPKDAWVKDLYEKHNLGKTPSLAKIEPVALKLLGNPTTSIEGAELVLGRRLDSKEELARSIMLGKPDSKLGILLLAKDLEAEKA